MHLSERPEGPVQVFADRPAEERGVVAGKREQGRPASGGLEVSQQPLRLRPFAGSVDAFDGDEITHAIASLNIEVRMRKKARSGQARVANKQSLDALCPTAVTNRPRSFASPGSSTGT